MRDQRINQLAKILLDHSVKLKEKQVLMINVVDEGHPLAKELVRLANERGAYPFVRISDSELMRTEMEVYSKDKAELFRKWEEPVWKDIDAYIALYGTANDYEMAEIPADSRSNKQQGMKPVTDYITNNIDWVRVNYPNATMAYKSGMSLDRFTDFYFDVCTADYAKMGEALKPLKKLMEQTDQVHIKGPGTDLRFSIKDMNIIPSSGEKNIPDGEIFTAPVRDSVEGTVTYNTPSSYQGTTFDNVKLTFKNGKIIEATSNNTEKINEIFDTDEGARFVGEFAIGVNPYILNPMNDILFDEKIAGSFHFTPGQAYEMAYNGNDSTVHWDLVCIQRPEYGGGEIYFDGKLIRKDGLFVPEELHGLNPDALK